LLTCRCPVGKPCVDFVVPYPRYPCPTQVGHHRPSEAGRGGP
jgi:hypothetical protein